MKNRKGFTLIELLVVVSIIALLVSILMPALAKAKQSALAAKCLVQVRNYNIGINLFAADHNDKLWYEGPNGASYGQRGHGLWMYRLRDYYDEADEARYCPVVNETDLSSVAMGGGAYHGSAFQSWNMAGHAGAAMASISGLPLPRTARACGVLPVLYPVQLMADTGRVSM